MKSEDKFCKRKESIMELLKEQMEQTLTIAIVGRLDTTTAPILDAELTGALENVKELVLDCSKMDYISSAGLRVLLSAQKKMNQQGSMKLIGVQEAVMDVFEITGFVDILTIE